MEEVSASAHKGLNLKGYWRKKKGYERINGTTDRIRKTLPAVDELDSTAAAAAADGSTKRRRFWRIKLTRPRLKLKLRFRFSPKKLLTRLRDAYVNMMLKMANSGMISGGGFGGGGFPGDGVTGFGARPVKEYDERMIVEIYKSIVMAQGGQVVPRDAAWVNSAGLTCHR